jgi:hypothetical protein
MVKMGKILTAIIVFGIFFIFPAVAQSEWTKIDLQSIYMEYLRNEGYVPSVDDAGDIQFRVSGDSYFIIIDENDIQFFQIYMGFSLRDANREDVLNAVNESNRRSKVAKLSVSPVDSERIIVSITVELLLNDPRDFIHVFPRAISLIRNAENIFKSRLRE